MEIEKHTNQMQRGTGHHFTRTCGQALEPFRTQPMVLVVPKGTYAGKLTNHRSLGADVIRARFMLVTNLSFKEDNYLIFKVN